MRYLTFRFNFVTCLLGLALSLGASFAAFGLEASPVKVFQEISATDYEHRTDELRKSLKQSPNSAALKQNLSIALSDWAQSLIEKKETSLAIEKLNEAVSIAPQNGPAWFVLGDIAYLHDSDFRNAIQYWKKALPLAPRAIQKQIEERISRAELDKHLERGYVSMSSTHFDIRFPVDFSKNEAERVAKYMESEYQRFSMELNSSPEKLTLIIYQKQSFDRVTGSHEETLGLYDGRIRIGVSEIQGQYESMILSHELAHAFLQHAFGNNLPIWIQEGYAQTKEPSRLLTREQKRIEGELQSGMGWIPIKWLDRKFSQPMNLEDVSRAYLESRIVVSFILRSAKASDFQSFLRLISTGMDVKKAFEATFEKMHWNAVEYGRFSQ